ncbi:MAG: hypothetical protein ABR585_12555 [Gemmatimonadaceae bacterium]|nr:hypothetical protein [Actinomycetota bacterium]
MIVTCKVCGATGIGMTDEMAEHFLLRMSVGDSSDYDTHKATGGWSRTETVQELCEDHDPLSWKNLSSGKKSFLVRHYEGEVIDD